MTLATLLISIGRISMLAKTLVIMKTLVRILLLRRYHVNIY